MIIIEKNNEFQLDKPSIVMIGKFDGVHMGHRELLKVQEMHRKEGLQSVIFTFDPSPAELFSGKIVPELSTKEEKRHLFKELGVDVLIEFSLTKESAAIKPEAFVEQFLVKQCMAKRVVAGTDVTFGDKGAGDANLLMALGAVHGFAVDLVDKISMDGAEVSSTRIRSLLLDGDMEEVRKLLGEPYHFRGIVEHGNQLGRTIDMPTANIIPEMKKLLPPNGVYFSKCRIDGKIYHGVSNIGRKPSVEQEHPIGIETFIYDFAEDIYDKTMDLWFYHYERPEKKFDSVESLAKQLRMDKENGKVFWREEHDL